MAKNSQLGKMKAALKNKVTPTKNKKKQKTKTRNNVKDVINKYKNISINFQLVT